MLFTDGTHLALVMTSATPLPFNVGTTEHNLQVQGKTSDEAS